jgi:hypothetical protein
MELVLGGILVCILALLACRNSDIRRRNFDHDTAMWASAIASKIAESLKMDNRDDSLVVYEALSTSLMLSPESVRSLQGVVLAKDFFDSKTTAKDEGDET